MEESDLQALPFNHDIKKFMETSSVLQRKGAGELHVSKNVARN